MAQQKKSGSPKKRVKAPRVALLLPRDANALLVRCLAIWDAIKADPARFGSPYPDPKKVDADLDALAAAIKAAEVGGAGAGEALRAAEEAVRADFAILSRYVESVVRAGPVEDAAETISSVLMYVSKVGQRAPKPALEVKRGSVGLWLLVAAALRSAVAYFWEQSTDQQTWTALPPTPRADTSLSGLVVGETYYFRFRALLRDGSMSELSAVVSIKAQ